MVADTDVFVRKYLLTDSKKVKALASKYNMEVKEQLPDDNTPKMIISGKAIFLTKNTLTEVAAAYKGGQLLPICKKAFIGVNLENLSFQKTHKLV